MTTVCLTMIVKNEAERIERCLASVLPHVDATCIVDTGSSDGTQALARAVNPSKVRIYEQPWVNFGFNRNQALAIAREDKYDYVLFLDADQELKTISGHEGYDYRDFLNAPAFNLWNDYGDMRLAKTCLLRHDIAAMFVGVTHEVLVLPEGVNAKTLSREMIRIVDHADGSNRKDKFQRDIDLLRAQLAVDPCNARACYYMAQSYRDMGEFGMALAWYEERMRLSGTEEEAWHAQYQRARMAEHLNWMPQEITHDYLMAWARRPWRSEPLWHLANYWKGRNQMSLYHMFAWQASQIRRPCDVQMRDDVLFIENGCYPHHD